MASPRKININLNSVKDIRSKRRVNLWVPIQNTVVGKVLIGLVSTVILCSIATVIIVPVSIAVTRETSNDIQTTVTTATATTVTTATTTTATTATTTTATTATTTSATTSTTTIATTTTSVTTTSTTSTTTTVTTTTTTATSSSTSTTTSVTTTTTTTTSTSCLPSGSATLAPGGQGGASVLYTFDGNPNDYYGNYNAVPHNNPQYVSPGYNGRGNAIQILSASSQYFTIANYMNFYRRSLTVEAWIYIRLQSTVVMLRNGYIYGSFFYDDISGVTLLQVNQWQHIAFTYDYTTQTQVVYLNGVADATRTSALPSLVTTGTQTIGCYNTYTGGFYDGYIDQLAILFNQSKTAAEILTDATLVVYYSMDCLSYINLDSGPNQINGITVGVNTGNGGRLGQSYLFNSTSAYFQVTDLVLLGQSYRPFSFVMWLRPIISVTNGGTILHLSQYINGTGSCVQLIGLNTLGQIVVQGYNASGLIPVVGPILTVAQWVHIVETYSRTNGVRLYVNGVLYGQSSSFVYAASGVPMTVTLGQPLNGINCISGGIQSGYYEGEIDEFAIYSRELSQADITTMANP